MKKFFTSESVTEGHPDKLCDYISDSVLDAYLEKDKNARVACETVAGKGEVLITGEITSSANVDIEKVARDAIKEVGYGDENIDIAPDKCKIHINISKQSPDIALGVDKSLENKMAEIEGQEMFNGEFNKSINEKNAETNVFSEGAGDQGIMFGFACDETPNLMPMPIYLAHKLAKRLAEVRKNGLLEYLRPDGKTQVTVEYDGNTPVRVDTVVLSTQHEENVDINILKSDIMREVVLKVIPKNLLDDDTKYYINPTGRFVIGGPFGDSGLTGRKIIVDTYGGYSRHGGGAFSGKDPTKVDRSASYMARHLAKNIVANGYAKRCEIQISYAIGMAKPISIYLDTFGTATIPEEEIIEKINDRFDLTPRGIINYLDLQKPIYRQTTNYGHFGRENLPWEKIVPFGDGS